MPTTTTYKTVIDSSLQKLTIALPSTILKSWSLTAGKQFEIQISSRTVQARVVASKDGKIHFSQQLAKELRMTNCSLSIRKKKETILLGPIVALYVIGNEKSDPPFPGITRLIGDTIRLGEQLGMYVYAVTPGRIDFLDRSAYGARFDGTNWRWNKQPFPDVVIRKAVNFPVNLYQTSRNDLARIEKDTRIRFLGKDIGNKWDVYALLKQYSSRLHQALPETQVYKHVNQIEELLRKYPVLYMKPVRGSQGKGIIRISQNLSQHSYSVELANGKKKQGKRIFQKSDLYRTFLNANLKKNETYIIQQGIDLLRDQQNIVDFRWLVQKLTNQKWMITARICRTAKTEQIATNLHMGGQAALAEPVLDKYAIQFGTTADEMIQEMDSLALETAEILDHSVGDNVEFGIDFAVDSKGKAWILEVNSRPGRKMLRLCQPEIRKQSLLRPLEYAKYATGFLDRK